MFFGRSALLIFVTILQNIDFGQLRKSASVSYCLSARPCEQVCPPSSTKAGNFRDGLRKPTLQQMSSTAYCIMGRCYCSQNRIDYSKCRSASDVDTSACVAPESNMVPGTPSIKPIVEKDKQVNVCKVKGKRLCKGGKKPTRSYCVIAIKPNATGFIPIPSLPGMGSVSLPTGSPINFIKNNTGQSSKKKNPKQHKIKDKVKTFIVALSEPLVDV